MILYEKAEAFVLHKLASDLPSHLTYHNADHTRQVIAAAELLAAGENISPDDLLLLKTAALFHDTGFLRNHIDHEVNSCMFAREWLPDYGYSPDQIAAICKMIMATRVPQSPEDRLSELLCDADLFYLGSESFQANADQLFQELKSLGILTKPEEWKNRQREFLSKHHYFTITARNMQQEKKDVHFKQLTNTEEKKPSSRSGNLEILQDGLLVSLGVIIAGIALKGFLVPNHFFDGGITGISLLTHEIYHVNLALVIVLFNLPLILVSYFSVGKRFAGRTFISIVLLGICLVLLPDFALTSDKLLISIFGGVFLGIGIGLIMRAGAALDGIEVLALYTLKRTSFTISEIILGINILIFSVAALNFGIETALYSILTYFAATRSIDYVVEGLQAYTGITIVSGKSEEIKQQLVNRLGRGITVYKGERGFLPGKFDISADCDIIFTVITRLEMRKLTNLVYEIDPKAFVFASAIKEATGGLVKRKHQH